MATRSLRSQIIGFLCASYTLAIVAAFLLFLALHTSLLREQGELRLNLASALLTAELEDREEELQQLLQRFASDSPLVRSVLSDSPNAPALLRQWQGLHAPQLEISLHGGQGGVLIASAKHDWLNQRLLAARSLVSTAAASHFLAAPSGQVYQVAVAPIGEDGVTRLLMAWPVKGEDFAGLAAEHRVEVSVSSTPDVAEPENSILLGRYAQKRPLGISVAGEKQPHLVLMTLGDSTLGNAILGFFCLLVFGWAALVAVAGWLAVAQIDAFDKLAQWTQSMAEGKWVRASRLRSPHLEFLGLVYALDSMQDRIQRLIRKIQYQATHDILTGLRNQDELRRIADRRIASQGGDPFHLVGINIGNFREINDVFGPEVAESCLVNIARFLEQEEYTAARFYRGGIVVLREGEADEVAAVVLAKRLTRHHGVTKFNIELDVCTSIVAYPDDGEDAEILMRRLEIGLDTAREAPFHFHRYDRGLEERYVKRISLVEDLRIAMIDWDAGLSMYYQPKLNLRTGQVEKMEALIRWEHPVRGAVSPEEFIPLAEQAGLIGELSRWIVAQVAAQLAAWRQRDIYLQVAVNLSAQDIMRPEMLTYIEEQRERYELPADCLTFEIIESELMENPSEAVVLLQRLRSSGYGLAIDDFGTGYSSLSQLKKMPVNEVKIDCEFVRVLSSDEDDRKIVRSTLALASSFGLDVTAEGVEDEDSLCLLSSWGCEWAQGFYISRGMPGPAVRAWLERFRRRDMSRVTEAFATKRVKI